MRPPKSPHAALALATNRSAPPAPAGQTFAMRNGQLVRTPPVYRPNPPVTARTSQAKMIFVTPPVGPSTIQPMMAMRAVPTASAGHALSQVHNVVDFMSFRTLGDLWWYKRAANRQDSKKYDSADAMSGQRILAGGASAIATRLAIGGAARSEELV